MYPLLLYLQLYNYHYYMIGCTFFLKLFKAFHCFFDRSFRVHSMLLKNTRIDIKISFLHFLKLFLVFKVINEQNETSYHSALKSVKPSSLLKKYKYVKKVKKVAILTIKSKNQKSIKSSTKIKET